MKRLALLFTAALFAGCGALPITIDLKKSIEPSGTFAYPLSGAPLASGEAIKLYLPDAEGLTLSFEPPSLPAEPASLVLDYRVRLNYEVTCTNALSGDLTARVYLAKDAASLWQSPVEGAEVSLPLTSSGEVVLEGKAGLTPEQIDALLSGEARAGVEAELRLAEVELSDPACEPEIRGSYEVDRLLLEIRFF